MIQQVLFSVSDKTGIVDLACVLHERGIKLLPTGDTAKLPAESSLSITEVADYTGSPETLSNRVKTLHPKIHGGILIRRDLPEHTAALSEHSIPTIDLLVVNLYPFQQMVTKDEYSLADAIENINIGGPTMLRSAVRNHRDVTVIINPADYATVLAEMQVNNSTIGYEANFMLAEKAFTRTAQYDGAIANYLTSLGTDKSHNARSAYPQTLNLASDKVQEMRYDENSRQLAVFYHDLKTVDGVLANYKQLWDKGLSYSSIADIDAAWECVKPFDAVHGAACVIIKHINLCGVVIGGTAREAYEKVFETDPTPAFGGIIAFNAPLDEATAQAVAKQLVEVLIAPGFSEDARAMPAAKQNVRVLEIPLDKGVSAYDFKRVGGDLLVQSPNAKNVQSSGLCMVTKRHPTPKEMDDLMFVWRVVKFVKSNTTVFCGGGMTLGVDAGQMNRVDSARIASTKAQNAGLALANPTVASDTSFSLRDGLDVAVDADASCVVQPGDSARDGKVIAAADERNVAMVSAGTCHFRH